MLNKNFSHKLLLKTMNKFNYRIFTGNLQLNIIGIRSVDVSTKFFNDMLYLFYHDNGKLYIKKYIITTVPGIYWLVNLLNKKGTAILKPDQYIDSHILGTHKNYTALIQQGKNPVTVYRDTNLNKYIDLDSKTEIGYFGINIHKASIFKITDYIGKWSAGCQVFKNKKDFTEFISICKLASDNQPNPGFFTYTLLDEFNIINSIGF